MRGRTLGYSAGYVVFGVGVIGAFQGSARFEVASIRLAPDLATVVSAMAPGKPPHLGTKIDGDRVDMGSISLTGLFCTAYSVARPDRVSGPDWMATQRFDVLAKLPAGATKEQVPDMVQALLDERFHLKFHRTNNTEPALALMIGPKGHKLEPGISDPQPDPSEKAGASNGPGFGGNSGTFIGRIGNGLYGPQRVSLSNGVSRVEFYNIGTKALAETFTDRLGRPVVDMTGLEGKFHVVLEYAQSDLLPAPSAGDQNRDPSVTADASLAKVYAAIDKLGFKLESRKVSVERFVIDHIEKLPTEN